MTDEFASPPTVLAPSLDGVTEKAPAWPPVRHPFQVSTMVAFAALGWAYYTTPSDALARIPDALIAAWVAILGMSGILGLISAAVAYRAENTSLLLERIALLSAGSFCTMYAPLSVWLIAWPTGQWVGVVIYGSLAGACWWRLWQVQKVVAWRKRRGKALLR